MATNNKARLARALLFVEFRLLCLHVRLLCNRHHDQAGLFGIVTMVEMGMVQQIHEHFPDAAWLEVVPRGRLQKARDIQAIRKRRNQYCVIDCMQLSDKAQILINDEESLGRLGFDSMSAAKRSVKELESLRNHLTRRTLLYMKGRKLRA